jgi:hypothetical protein
VERTNENGTDDDAETLEMTTVSWVPVAACGSGTNMVVAKPATVGRATGKGVALADAAGKSSGICCPEVNGEAAGTGIGVGDGDGDGRVMTVRLQFANARAHITARTAAPKMRAMRGLQTWKKRDD